MCRPRTWWKSGGNVRTVHGYGDDADAGCSGNVVVIDLSLRIPLGGEFFDSMLDRLLDDDELKTARASPTEAVVRGTAERLAHPQVRAAAESACRAHGYGRQAGNGAELWILFARMVFEKGERGDYQRTDWYSEALFERDDRFDLTEALQCGRSCWLQPSGMGRCA